MNQRSQMNHSSNHRWIIAAIIDESQQQSQMNHSSKSTNVGSCAEDSRHKRQDLGTTWNLDSKFLVQGYRADTTTSGPKNVRETLLNNSNWCTKAVVELHVQFPPVLARFVMVLSEFVMALSISAPFPFPLPLDHFLSTAFFVFVFVFFFFFQVFACSTEEIKRVTLLMRRCKAQHMSVVAEVVVV